MSEIINRICLLWLLEASEHSSLLSEGRAIETALKSFSVPACTVYMDFVEIIKKIR